MASDATTFFLAFTFVFAGIAGYLLLLERKVGRLQERVQHLAAQLEAERERND